MWWKFPLLLILCAPLAYRAWREIDDPAVRMPSMDLPSRDELAKQKTHVQELQKVNGERAFDEELTGVVARIGGESPRGSSPLVKAVAAHASATQEVREFARVYVELESDPGRPAEIRDAEMKRWLEERRGLVKGKKDEQTALVARLETLNGKVKSALRRRDMADMDAATEDIEAALTALRKHRTSCEGFRVLMAWADTRTTEWGQLRDLLAIARSDANILKIGEREEVLRHVGRYARLFETAQDKETRTLIRAETLRFCESYVPTMMMEDAMVLYRDKEVPREKIWINWKKGVPDVKQYGEVVQLVRTRYDEFNPPNLSSVAYYYRTRTEGDDTFTGQIEPTTGNRASRYFNERRKSLAWTETALRSLMNSSPVKWTSQNAMPVPFRRAEQLLEAIAKHPALFGRGDG